MWKKISLLCLILFEICLVSGICLQNAECEMQNAEFSNETVLSFADYLFGQEDYYRAASEYQRFIFIAASPRETLPPREGATLNQDEETIQRAMFKIGLCYQKSRQWNTALTYFEELKQKLHGRTDAIVFEIGRTNYLKGDYPQAIKIFQRLTVSRKLGDESQYMLGWCYLKQMDWGKAEIAFDQIKSETSVYTFSQELAEFAKNGAKLPHKSPLTAGIMSLLFPGAGQAYLHRFGDGTFSMLLTLGTTWLGYHYYHEGYKNTGSILTGLGITFYGGNIYGAAASAKLINASSRANYLEQIDRLDKERGVTIEYWK
ncbi:hypothetical protein AUJ95_04190 [Candidatus Desantisbacteria bacterium CG2_30_40_21]|nr:MAG: hypothetical protein AUJ95_04190 [Candidatus Desantisbacteria bacterium CG2_30_40_21]